LQRQENALNNIVIKRCPVFSSINRRAQELAIALKKDLGLDASIKDEKRGEFSVLAGGIPVIHRICYWLPSVGEVEAAIWNAIPTKIGM
jgi:hypothetical protein